jgi:hypothetical protein
MRFLILSLIILLGLSSPAISGTRDPQTPDAKHLAYGELHQCVVPVRGTAEYPNMKEDETANFFGSGVIVAPHTLITAAHVLNYSTESYILVNGKKNKILGYAKLDGTDQEKEVGPDDIAVALLQNPVELDFYPKLYTKDNELGKLCSVAGWGMSGTWITGTVNDDCKRRAGSNHVDKLFFKGMLVTSVETGTGTSLEYLIGNGDSGGGLFIDKKLAGIHSCIFTGDGKLDSSFKDWAAHTRISTHAKWLQKMIDIFEAL